MSINTIFRDNVKHGYREAWQNGVRVFEWSRRDVDTMHAEVPDTVPVFGHYAADTPVAPGKRRCTTP